MKSPPIQSCLASPAAFSVLLGRVRSRSACSNFLLLAQPHAYVYRNAITPLFPLPGLPSADHVHGESFLQDLCAGIRQPTCLYRYIIKRSATKPPLPRFVSSLSGSTSRRIFYSPSAGHQSSPAYRQPAQPLPPALDQLPRGVFCARGGHKTNRPSHTSMYI